MVHVNIHSKESLSQREMSLLAHMMFIMCTNEEFAEEKHLMMNDGLTLTRRTFDADGNETGVEREDISRADFVRAVDKGMNSTLELTIQTKDGDKTIRRPFFPVTLVDLPIIQKAGITLDYVPEFLPQFNNGILGFIFRGELLNFAQQDVDEAEN